MDLIAGTKALGDVVQRDALSEVDFVPATRRRDNVQQIISSTRMHSAFHHLGGSYDLILIDTAPVLANADIAALADVLDACLFVVRWGSTPREAVASALRQLRLLNVPAAGIVLTGVNPAEADSDAQGKFYDQLTRYHTYRGAA
jgi:polysaccharide biosynthesis transport protein